jgi:hypothetical protein
MVPATVCPAAAPVAGVTPERAGVVCRGDAIPVLDDAGGKVRDSYTYCPTWQAEKQRIAEGREQLKGGGLAPEPDPPVAHFDDGRGNVREAPVGSTYDDPDPWSRARRDLDVLVPEAG